MAEAADGPWQTLCAIRAQVPLVHNMTNLVALDLAANLLLAAGAAPALAQAPEEIEEILERADALTINIGMLSADRVEPMVSAARKAIELGLPWVLDPGGVGATAFRDKTAKRLAHLQPTVIRGNGAEILSLGGGRASGHGPGLGPGLGIESDIDSAEALDAAADLAKATGAVVAVTGAVDYVTDGAGVVAVANGHALMGRVTALGCALTCLVGACCAVSEEPMEATAHGLAIMGLAGELAAAEVAGPGSFRVALLDALYNLDEPTLNKGVRIQ